MKKFATVFLISAFACAPAMAGILFQQSFEDPALTGGQYVDTGDPLVDHDLVNNAGEAAVDVPGADASYVNTRDGVGLTDGDWVGVTTFTGDVGAYTDGIAGYQMSDADGKMVLTFDEVPGAVGVSFDLFVNATGYEADDSIRISYGSDVLFESIGDDIEFLPALGQWVNFIEPVGSGQLVFELDCNSGSEVIYIDNVIFYDDLPVSNDTATWSQVKRLYQ